LLSYRWIVISAIRWLGSLLVGDPAPEEGSTGEVGEEVLIEGRKLE
jgi:hypothetical protein